MNACACHSLLCNRNNFRKLTLRQFGFTCFTCSDLIIKSVQQSPAIAQSGLLKEARGTEAESWRGRGVRSERGTERRPPNFEPNQFSDAFSPAQAAVHSIDSLHAFYVGRWTCLKRFPNHQWLCFRKALV